MERTVDIGQRARQREPVFERVAGAGGRLGPVAQHPPLAVRPAAEIDGIDAQVPAAERLDTHHRPQEFRAAGKGGRRDDAFGH